jgi:GNAT superfamily N-acetyltransferase
MKSVRASDPDPSLPPSPIPGLRTIELSPPNAPLLQRFFDRNPAYFLATSGQPAGPLEAEEEITTQVPADMSYTKKWVIGYVNESGDLAAMANVITDLLAPTVQHVATFIVATDRHGTGDAQRLYAALERWAHDAGGAWMRLGVVLGNIRAERFWLSQGYRPVAQRTGVEMGPRTVTIQVMCKPLRGGARDEYLILVPRDREAPQGER